MRMIQVSHVTKEFRLGELQSLKRTLKNALARTLRRPVEQRPLLKALDDVNLQVDRGEVVGIIGHNGAGKSTLLKTLAGITRPTTGTVRVRGRVAPLIEVGAGLVPDLTGRENIYLNAAILGMKRSEIKRKFDSIVQFAELENFIDTPIKRYSSGMQVRLGFAIAASVDAEILIVDEVLAVGDLAFQRKCFDRMEEMITRQGRTVLIVSHNIRQIERLCSRVIMLDRGRIAADGSPKDVCERFYVQSNEKIAKQTARSYKTGRNIESSGEVNLKSLTLRDANGEARSQFTSGASMIIEGAFESAVALPHAEIMYGLHTTDMVYIATMGTAHLGAKAIVKTGLNVIECRIPALPLVPGTYAIRVCVLDRYRRQLFYCEMLHPFTVTPKDIPASKMSALGLVHIPAHWQFKPQASQGDLPPNHIRATG